MVDSNVVALEPANITLARPFGSPMPCIQHNTQLNQLVVDIGCSLLQFLGEVSPWSPAGATVARDTVARLLKQQKHHVEQLVELLQERRFPVEFGLYPAEFTDLHFMSLKAMLPRAIDNQNVIVSELDEAIHTCIDDAGAIEVLSSVLAGEKAITAELKSLVLS